MAGEPTLTLVGNLTADPEVRHTSSGATVASFTIASTPRVRDGDTWTDGEALFMRCTAWRQLAEHLAGAVRKGDRLLVVGRLRQRTYDTREGEKRTVVELEVDEAGPSLRYAAAEIRKTTAAAVAW